MPEKPNIVLIITDHQAFFGHDREGEYTYKWPAYEAFAEAGARFERAYTICPLCSPARSSMMTGQYPSTHGIRWNTDANAPSNRNDFRSGQLLYSHYLAQAGYRNAYVGKWHCGHERLPVDYGIEGWSLPDYGKVYMSEAYRQYAAEHGFGDARARIEYNLDHPEWRGQTLRLHDPSPWTFMNGAGVLEGPPEAHEEQFVAHLAIEKLRELARSNQPFSLVVSFWGPHQPYYPTEPFASMIDPLSIPEYPSYRDDGAGRPLRHLIHREIGKRTPYAWPEWSIWQDVLARCYAQGLQTDAAIGGVLDAIDQLGLRENTFVIWCADHGDAVASHGGLWDKSSTFIEEVARVPLAMRWPEGFGHSIRVSQLVSNMDVTATMLYAAGVAIPDDMHSRSLLPLCQPSGTAHWPDQLICEHHGHGYVFPQRIIYHDRYKYVASLYDMDEMYDLEADPYEMHNLVNDPQFSNLRANLRERIIGHLESSSEEDVRLKTVFLLALRRGL
ncbi:MAG: sulfatase-like hydrolase/transferase [Anaerolineae bacterium]